MNSIKLTSRVAGAKIGTKTQAATLIATKKPMKTTIFQAEVISLAFIK